MKKIFIILSFVAIIATVGSLFVNNKANSIFSQNVEALSGTRICFNSYVTAYERDPSSSFNWWTLPDVIDPHYSFDQQRCIETKCSTKSCGVNCVCAVTCFDYDD